MKAFAKTLLALGGAGLAVFLGGCIVRSVYPFYFAKDVVFDAALLGTWSENGTADDKETWAFEKLGAKAYQVTLTGKSETNRFEAYLFQLKQQKFLDLSPVERKEGHLPVHFILKVDAIQPIFKISPLGEAWLRKLLEQDPKSIRHIRVSIEPGSTNRNEIILTAETKELQEFVLKYASDTNAFSDPVEWKRWK